MDAMAPLVDVRELSVRFAAGPTTVDAVSRVSFSVATLHTIRLGSTAMAIAATVATRTLNTRRAISKVRTAHRAARPAFSSFGSIGE